MPKSIKMAISFLLLSSTFSLAVESNKTFVPIIMDSIITFAVIDNGPDIYEATLTSNDDVVLIQKSTKLMWVNEPDVSKGKCKKIHKATFQKDFSEAKGFCKSSQFGNFAGHSNWRTPTSSELKTFIKATKNMDVNYDAHCDKLLALKDTQTNNESSDSSYTTISTRFNSLPIGTDLNSLKPNIGLRCVRTITESL
jgi:hypothetical protein